MLPDAASGATDDLDAVVTNSGMTPETKENTSAAQAAIGLYVHIPYCRRRCRYCDFAIVPIGPKAATEKEDPDNASSSFATLNLNYTSALLQELDHLQTQHHQGGNKNKIPLRSIYFGGGTPSLAPIETLQRILSAILDPERSPFAIDERECCEITIEMDPGTFSREKLQAVKDMGFNRISLGVQSFDDRILESLGRIHRSQDIYESIAMIQDIFGATVNYSLDLISGVPGLSLAAWTDTLEKAVNLEPRPVHLSVYDLQVEQGTVFGTWYGDQTQEASTMTTTKPFQSTRGEAPVSKEILRLPSPDEAAFMYRYASGYLRSKLYEHYEVSSYALLPQEPINTTTAISPYRSQHNQIYWALDGQWYAIGLGATSFVGGHIKERPRTLIDYQRWVADDLLSSSSSSTRPVTVTSELDLLEDHVLKRLRTSEGLPLDWIEQRFGCAYRDAIIRGAQLGIDLKLATIQDTASSSRRRQQLKLMDPDGFLFSNSIISSIFVELEAV